MSIEATLTLVGILVTVALALLGALISCFGWWIGREVGKYDELWKEHNKLRERMMRVEQALGIKSGSDTIKFKGGPA